MHQPLTKELNVKEQATALQIFKNVTGFMGDRKSSKNQVGHAKKILAAG